jgi:hypothetical protein
MTEIQAGIGRIQLKKLFFYLKRRRENYLIYSDELKKFNLVYLPVLPKNNLNAPYRFYMYLNHKYIKKNIRIQKILKEINRKGVDCGSGSCSEIYLENSFKKLFAKKKENLQKKKIASYLTRNAMAFKLDPTYTKKKIHNNLTLKSNKSTNYTKTEVDDGLALKAPLASPAFTGAISTTGNIICSDATATTISANESLTFEHVYGTTSMILQNRNGVSGVVFQTTNPIATPTDLIFQTGIPTTSLQTRHIRLEARSAFTVCGVPEIQNPKPFVVGTQAIENTNPTNISTINGILACSGQMTGKRYFALVG